ncbi:hypothetical protein K439DRAFT_1632971 [Ramaria rubella]|nr:hypothetical protein K439DRAFT_1632971 [Ramaria rubella]
MVSLKLSFPVVLAALTNIVIAVPSTIDWKYLHGWDGVVSDPASIGTPSDETLAANLIARAASTPGGIFICDGQNWTGTCGYAVQPLNTCIVLGDDWDNRIASLGPDEGAAVVVYNASDCTGNSFAFVFPGSGDLQSLGWGDIISSFEAVAVLS